MESIPRSIQATPPITVTGADERTDLDELGKLDAEIGLLFTANPNGRNRYPRWGWIREAAGRLDRVALHVCGRPAREQLATGRLEVDGFQRIQVNGRLQVAEVERLCDLYPQQIIITQHDEANADLLAVRSPNHAILIDASGGRGISPTTWEPPRTSKPVGFAGGLGPSNLANELGRIETVARDGWWVDMEEKLRVDDWFSVQRAAQCVAVIEIAAQTRASLIASQTGE